MLRWFDSDAPADYVEDDPCSNPSTVEPIGELISRRGILRMTAAVTAGVAANSLAGDKQSDAAAAKSNSAAQPSTLGFRELNHGDSTNMVVAF